MQRLTSRRDDWRYCAPRSSHPVTSWERRTTSPYEIRAASDSMICGLMKSVWRAECWKELQGRMSMWASLCPPVCPSTVSLPLDLPLRVLKRVTVWHHLYTALDYDPSNEIRKKVNSYLETLYDMKLLVKEEYLHLFANSSTTPLFYCLAKIHKIGYPVRPIVSFIASPTYNIAKLISKLLMPSTDKAHPKQLRSKRKVIIIPDTHIVLVSFDVKGTDPFF